MHVYVCVSVLPTHGAGNCRTVPPVHALQLPATACRLLLQPAQPAPVAASCQAEPMPAVPGDKLRVRVTTALLVLRS